LARKLAEVVTRLRYDRWLLALLVPLGVGPRHSEVRTDADTLHVRMGWGFAAHIPLSSIKSAGPSSRPVLAWGAHGFRGDWLVNGSSKGIVDLVIDPAATARVLGIPTPLKRLRISVTQPDALIQAVTRP
jgi:hypothetical protein